MIYYHRCRHRCSILMIIWKVEIEYTSPLDYQTQVITKDNFKIHMLLSCFTKSPELHHLRKSLKCYLKVWFTEMPLVLWYRESILIKTKPQENSIISWYKWWKLIFMVFLFIQTIMWLLQNWEIVIMYSVSRSNKTSKNIIIIVYHAVYDIIHYFNSC